jgi:hypothetical protein
MWAAATRTCEECGRVFGRQDKPGLIYGAFMRLRFCSQRCSQKAVSYERDTFLKYVVHQERCWGWTGPLTDKGYGIVQVKGRKIGAHRLSYEYFKGPIPDGLHVLHSCDNPPCVNPDHLSVGTHQQNMREAKERKRFNNPGGEVHPSAKLTTPQAREVLDHPDVPGSYFARKFGVSKSTIYAIRNGDNWKVLHDAAA